MLVGVARSVEELIAAHGSVPRHAAQIEVKPMTEDALAEIIQRGFAMSGMTFDEGLDRRIAHLSQGYPHYTHLLGLWSGRLASMDKRTHVTAADLDAAIPTALKTAIAGVRQQYEKAVQSAQPRTLYKDVLLACAIAKKDALGKFPVFASDGHSLNQTEVCRSGRGVASSPSVTQSNLRTTLAHAGRALRCHAPHRSWVRERPSTRSPRGLVRGPSCSGLKQSQKPLGTTTRPVMRIRPPERTNHAHARRPVAHERRTTARAVPTLCAHPRQRASADAWSPGSRRGS